MNFEYLQGITEKNCLYFGKRELKLQGNVSADFRSESTIYYI